MTTFCTANLDFGKSRDQHRRYLAYLITLCDVLLVQEAKKIRLRWLLPRTCATMQRIGTASRRGSAVSWVRPRFHRNTRLRVGSRPVGVVNGRPKIARMMTRWLAMTDMRIGSKATTVISAHWPPLRYSWLWPQMDRNVARVIIEKVHEGREVLLGADFNHHPSAVVDRLNVLLKGHGIRLTAVGDGRIDGFVHTSGLKVAARRVDTFGQRAGLTDHPCVFIDVVAA